MSAAFAIAVLCFFLPFIGMSCQGQPIAEFTGVQTAFGTTIEQPQMFGDPEEGRIPPNPLAMGALVAGLIGAVVSLRWRRRVAVLLGFAAAGMLLLLRVRTDASVLEEGSGMLQAEYRIGFWGALLLFSIAGVAGLVADRQGGAVTASTTAEPTVKHGA